MQVQNVCITNKSQLCVLNILVNLTTYKDINCTHKASKNRTADEKPAFMAGATKERAKKIREVETLYKVDSKIKKRLLETCVSGTGPSIALTKTFWSPVCSAA